MRLKYARFASPLQSLRTVINGMPLMVGTLTFAVVMQGCAADANPEATASAAPAAASPAPAPAPTMRPEAPAPSMAPAPAPAATMAQAPATAVAGTAAPARIEAPAGQNAPEVTGTERLQEAGLAIESALAAAAEIQGTDECDTAYRALGRMVAEMQRRMPEAVTPGGLPPRDAFVELCRELPPELQRCLQIGYAMQHQQECAAQRDNMDPALAARLEAMMQSGTGGDE